MNPLRRAREIDQRYRVFNTLAKRIGSTGSGVLKGVAVSVKDNICVRGMESRAGSKILEGYIPPFDATVVAKAKDEGAYIIGKTTQDEFGFGTFNVNTPYKVPLNPHDTERSAGGSSGGAAALTYAADFPHVAIVESTGGSISCPASWCGVVGITPTYGRTSRWGLIDYANSLDKIGCMGKTVKEAARLLSVISGSDRYDSTVMDEPLPDFHSYGDEPAESTTVGIPEEYFGQGVDEGVSKMVWKALKELECQGVELVDVSLPLTKYSLSSYYIIAMSEASTNLAKLCGLRYGLHLPLEGNFDEYFSEVRGAGYGMEAKRRIILGTYARLAGYRDAYYLKALKVRTKVIEDFKRTFKEVDVLAAPTMPSVAPRFDEVHEMEPIQHYMMDILTVAPNLAGVPMISVPCGAYRGLPVGLHIMGDHLEEDKIIRVAASVEGS